MSELRNCRTECHQCEVLIPIADAINELGITGLQLETQLGGGIHAVRRDLDGERYIQITDECVVVYADAEDEGVDNVTWLHVDDPAVKAKAFYDALVDAQVEVAKDEILSDAADFGAFKVSEVRSFSALADHVDANEYGGLTDDAIRTVFANNDDWIVFANDVQTKLDLWLESDGLRKLAEERYA